MPNRNVHTILGGLAGGCGALYRARDEQPEHALLEALGGILAGASVGCWPDRLDPPTHPGHRSGGHAIVPVGVALTGYMGVSDQVQSAARHRANRFELALQRSSDPLARLLFLAGMVACRMASGAIGGAPYAYGCHLAADATTPKGLPWLG